MIYITKLPSLKFMGYLVNMSSNPIKMYLIYVTISVESGHYHRLVYFRSVLKILF